MNKAEQAAKQARALFSSQDHGILSTHSVDLPGYPFGSITPYCLNRAGQPVILISSIAQHTHNILANNKVSLIVAKSEVDDAQSAGRITYIGDAKPIAADDDEIAERYYRYFPSSRNFHQTHDFNFYAIDLVRARFIGGFGQIYWVEQTDFLKANPFSMQEETDMVNHMNNDHQTAMQHYCDLFDIGYNNENQPTMIGIDSEGFHLRTGSQLHRIEFESPVSTALEVRQAMVELAKRQS
ncbi:MAG: HugZ family protein [Proteobacteria bacterium]|nr:HugZ family protein [Pseudomonadota bacterium]